MKMLDPVRLARAAEGLNKALARLADAEEMAKQAEIDMREAAQGVADANAEFDMASQPVEQATPAPKAPAVAAGTITEKSRA